jgi:tRNA(fMet)-specific endonuclease VapC
MFVILDTNHYQELAARTAKGETLEQRLMQAQCDAFTTVVTIQEVTQGWLAEINRRPAGRGQVSAYSQFLTAVSSFENITVLPFDEEAAAEFHRLRKQRVRVGTMDLKIAAIARSHAALLLSRNLADFERVPHLHVENWLD